ncbi:hypothetical protein AAMO2058_000037600 [Amorphochlora amoebiformis]
MADRTKISEKRVVIDEKLIINAVLEYRRQYLDDTIADLQVEEDVDLDALEELSMTHQRIYKISNLEGYDNLRKLVLNNNKIEKIENLDTLMNLEWLDLSFNRIKKIEGLDKLEKLTDLSLHNNLISSIDGLDNLKKLQILSLGENEISSSVAIESLRPYKSLRVLNLMGNPVAKKDNYVASVIAFLPQIQYLDYKLLQPTAQQRDYHPSELDDILKEEKKKGEEEKLAMEKEVLAKHDEKMNVAGLRTLFEDMLTEDKTYNDVIVKFGRFAGFKQEVMAKYEREFRKEVENYFNQTKNLFEAKQEEEISFSKAHNKADEKAKEVSVKLIKEFENLKIKAIDDFTSGEDDKSLEFLKEELKKLEKSLMEAEMLLVEQNADLFDEFQAQLRKGKDKSNASRSEFQMKIADIVQGYQTKLTDFIDRERERLQEEDELDGKEDDDEILGLMKTEEKLKEVINLSYESQKDFIEELVKT